MNNERIDPETLAAFLDGTLPAADRERLLSALARGGVAYEDLIEARVLLDAASAGATEEKSRPPPAAPALSFDPFGERRIEWWRRGKTWGVGAFLTAASIATVVLLQRRSTADAATPLVRVIQSVSAGVGGTADVEAALGLGRDHPGWNRVRGASESVSERGRAFQMGVRFADQDVAFAAGDTAAGRAILGALARLAGEVETGAPVAARIRYLADSRAPPPAAADRRQVAAELRDLVREPHWFDLGAWSEAARFAAHSRQATFFAPNGPAMRELARIVAALDEAPEAERRAAESIVEPLRQLSQMPVASPSDLAPIAAALDSTVAQGGR